MLVGPSGFGEWQHREIQLGLDRQASAAKAGQAFPVIPVLLPGLANDAVPVGSFLSLNTWVDLRQRPRRAGEPSAPHRGRAGRAIDAAAAEKLLAGLTPYRGLLPFREQDAGLFFGRERFVREPVSSVADLLHPAGYRITRRTASPSRRGNAVMTRRQIQRSAPWRRVQ